MYNTYNMKQPVILTGLRANNDLHIGNYLGALLPLVDLARTRSDSFQINIFVPDLHSFTTPIDHSCLYAQTIQNLKIYVAAGLPIDKENVFVYRQSYISAHSELTWILDCFTGFGEMNRMTQYKDKSAKLGDDRVSVGLFNYPVLMAADILLYGATYIPVGDDQTQHLEFTRDIAQRMNNQFGDLFVVPKPVKEQHAFFGKDQGLRIRDLGDPNKKMSKSDETGKGVIFLSDSIADVRKKIMSATTDSLGKITYDYTDQPGVSNLLDLLALFTDQCLDDVLSKYEGQVQYGPLKSAVSDAICGFISDFQEQLQHVDEAMVLEKLERSEETMRTQATETLSKAQQAVGLRPILTLERT